MGRQCPDNMITEEQQFGCKSGLSFHGKGAWSVSTHEDLPRTETCQEPADDIFLLGTSLEIGDNVVDKDGKYIPISIICQN